MNPENLYVWFPIGLVIGTVLALLWNCRKIKP